jgi:hypothetical protein
MEIKCCIKCEKIKPISGFHRKTKAKDGFQPWCKTCASKGHAEYRIQHAEELSDKAAKYYIENREKKIIQVAEYYTKHAKEIISYTTEYNLQRKYGLTIEKYNEMLETQDNGCIICGKTPEENGKRLDVDHNHNTGKVRGLLCGNCNRALGLLQDNPELCRQAMLYLRRTEK